MPTSQEVGEDCVMNKVIKRWRCTDCFPAVACSHKQGDCFVARKLSSSIKASIAHGRTEVIGSLDRASSAERTAAICVLSLYMSAAIALAACPCTQWILCE